MANFAALSQRSYTGKYTNPLKPFLLLLLHRNSVMFNNELMADVHFVVGQTGRTERLPGHRVRLPSASKITAAGRKLTNELSATVSSVSDERGKKQSRSFPAVMEPKSLCSVLMFCNHVSSGDSPQLFMQMRQGGQRHSQAGSDVLFSSHTAGEAAAFVSAGTQLFTANATITRLLIKRSQSAPITSIRQPCIQLASTRIRFSFHSSLFNDNATNRNIIMFKLQFDLFFFF